MIQISQKFSRKILLCIFLVNVFIPAISPSVAHGSVKEHVSAYICVGYTSIDTSIYVLDNEVSCGSNSSVRLSAGVAKSYEWYRDFAKIPGATQKNYTALVSGMYKVISYDDFGKRDSSRGVNIYIVPRPVALFSIEKKIQCNQGNEFNPVNESTIEKGSMTFTWHFGDGQFQLGKVVSHRYASIGNYKLTLVATSDFGCSDTSVADVSVVSAPKVDFDINTNSQCLSNNIFKYVNNSSMDTFLLEYRWDFGDGIYSTAKNPSHSYIGSGAYKVKLVAFNNKACADSIFKQIVVHPKPVALFSVNNNEQCENGNYFQFTNTSTISLGRAFPTWYFGNGILSSEISPNYSYSSPGTYRVVLVQTSEQGCKDSIFYTMQVNPSPVVKFDPNQQVQCFQGHNFIFSNQSKISTGQLFYQWDFGDGIGQSTSVAPQYAYQTFGSYQVTLRVNTSNNCLSTLSKIVTVHPTTSADMIDPSSTVICDGSYVTLQANKNEGYQWLLDNKAIPSANGQSFNATLPGVYALHSRNEYGCVYVSPKTIQLTKVFQPIANFTNGSTCVNIPTLFNNTSDTSKSGLVDFLWYFGDSASSTLSSPAHTYKSQGNYSPRLTITPRFCKQLSVTKSVQLTIQSPEIPLRYAPVNAVSGKDLQLKARAFSGASYVWSPGTGISLITSPQPIFKNTSPQTYLIRIVNAAGCVFTDTLEVRMFTSQEIFVPEIFSPNNDGKNDKLNVFLVGITKLKMFKVFNRWGQLMFQLRNEADGWDGTHLGMGQPVGTYLWQAEGLDIEGKIIRRSGTTVLIR